MNKFWNGWTAARKSVWSRAGISLIFSLIVAGMFFLSEGIIQVNRNGGEEYLINLSRQAVRQTLETNQTTSVTIYLLPLYQESVAAETGIQCTVENGDKKIETFVPLNSLQNNGWTNIKIIDPRLKQFKGKTVVSLSGIGMNEQNDAQMIVSLSKENSSLFNQLYINNEPAEGILCMVYSYIRYDRLVKNILVSFVLAFGMAMLLPALGKIAAGNLLVTLAVLRYGISMLLYRPTEGTANTFWTTLYTYSWNKVGVIRRSFPGTIVSLLDRHFTVSDFWTYALLIQLAMLLGLCSLFRWKSVKENSSLSALVLMYIASPLFISYYTQGKMFGGFDILMLLYLAACYLMIHFERFLPGIPLVCVCAIMTHEMFVLYSMPFLVLILLYRWLIERKRKYGYVFAGTVILSGAVLFYLMVFSKIPYPEFEQIITALSEGTNRELILPHVISYYWFTSLEDQLFADFLLVQQLYIPFKWLLGVLFLWPLLQIVCRFWRRWIQIHSENGGIEGLIVKLFWACPVLFLIGCIKACDWGRWSVLFFSSAIFSIIQINDFDKENAAKSLEYAFVPLKKVWGKSGIILSCCYLLLLGSGDTAILTPICETVARYLIPFFQ